MPDSLEKHRLEDHALRMLALELGRSPSHICRVMRGERKPRVCGRCPKWGEGYCRIAAKLMVAEHPACEYGAKKINSRDTAARARRRGISTQRRRDAEGV